MIDRRYLVLIGTLLLVTVAAASQFEEYAFNDITRESVISLLTPLFIISLFVERAQEVFISAWREPGKREIEARVEALNRAKVSLTSVAVESDASVLTAVSEVRPAKSPAADAELSQFKANTQRLAFLAGLSAGILISVAGVRVLHPLVNWDADVAGVQKVVFDTVDIILTGGLLGGGAEGLHKLVSVITDFLDATRKRAQGTT